MMNPNQLNSFQQQRLQLAAQQHVQQQQQQATAIQAQQAAAAAMVATQNQSNNAGGGLINGNMAALQPGRQFNPNMISQVCRVYCRSSIFGHLTGFLCSSLPLIVHPKITMDVLVLVANFPERFPPA